MAEIVRRTLAEAMFEAQDREELAALAARPDTSIDLSEIPELTDQFWLDAARNKLYRPVKKQVTVRIDADILEWLRSEGAEGYQTRLNAVLRAEMLRDLQAKP